MSVHFILNKKKTYCFYILFLPVVLLAVFFLGTNKLLYSQEPRLPIDLSVPLEPSLSQNKTEENVFANENRMPNDVLCFPPFTQDYLRKIYGHNGHYEIWSQRQISRWAQAQGFRITTDKSNGGYRFQYAMVFYAPGLHFQLVTPADANGDKPSPFGWKLTLDMGFLEAAPKQKILSSDFKFYQNILRYKIIIDGIEYRTIEIGFGKTSVSPITIAIPYIRNKEGKVNVEIRLANHPSNFAVLYDAYLSRE